MNKQFHFEKFLYFNGSIFKPDKGQGNGIIEIGLAFDYHLALTLVMALPWALPLVHKTYLQSYHSLLTSFAHIFANILLWNGWIIAYFFSNLFFLSIDLTRKNFSLQPLNPLEWSMDLFFSPPPPPSTS